MGSTTGNRHITRTLGVFCALTLTALFIFSAPAYSANRYWIGGDGDWGTASYWSDDEGNSGVPATGDTAWLNSSGPVAYTSDNPAIRELIIEASAGNSMVLNHSSGTLTLAPYGEDASYLYINATGNNGSGTASYAAYNLSEDGVLVKGAGEVKIGTDGTGYFNQSGGEFQLMGALYLGDSATGHGVYSMTGGILTGVEVSTGVYDGDVELFETQYGGIALGEWAGTGVFNQSGDSYVTIGTLELARQANSTGMYTLDEGELTVRSYENIGLNGTGTFTQNGGKHTVEGDLTLGVEPTGNGTYNLHGGELTASNVFVGDYGTGTFTQDGGTHYIGMGTDNFVQDGLHELIVGRNEGSNGSYALGSSYDEEEEYLVDSGNLYVKREIVGDAGGFGAFEQSGESSHYVYEDLIIGQDGDGDGTNDPLPYGSFVLSDSAVLEVGGDLILGDMGGSGAFAQSGESELIIYGALSIGTQSEGEDDSLWTKGGYVQESGSATVHGNLIMGENASTIGRYLMEGGILDVFGNEHIGNQGTGILDSEGSVIQAGGSFTQTGGTHTVGEDEIISNLVLGSQAGSQGEYILGTEPGEIMVMSRAAAAGPSLIVNGNEYIGDAGTGTFTQYGGMHEVNRVISGYDGNGDPFYNGGDLVLGSQTGAYGSYNLSGGTLTAFQIYVGSDGTGDFHQDGDSTLEVGQDLVLRGTSAGYYMDGGTINATRDEYIGSPGMGVFTQTGGSNYIGRSLVLGMAGDGSNPGHGTYYLYGSNAFLGAYNMIVGTGLHGVASTGGTGIFNQYGGTVTTTKEGDDPNKTGNLRLANSIGSTGSYNLYDGGTLNVGGLETVGRRGDGTFNQYGGTHTVTGVLTVKDESSATGAFNLSGGTLNAEGGIVNNGTFVYSGGTLKTDAFNNYGEFIGSGMVSPLLGDGSVRFVNHGTVSPGNSPGALTINGDYLQGGDGILEIELGGYVQGDSYDYLAITGTAELDGALNLILWNDFTPEVGDTFDILYAAGGLTGEFASISAPSGWIWSLSYLDLNDNDTLYAFDTVRVTANAVPIPGTLLMLGTGLLGLLGIRRRMAAR